MNNDIAQQLKNTRESLGFSIKDVAEATRLRSDYINHMENGSFDYDLPEIYKRGFLRIYAQFLNLDVDSIMKVYSNAPKMAEEQDKSVHHLLEKISIDNEKNKAEFINTDDVLDDFDDEKISKNEDSKLNLNINKDNLKLIAIFIGVALVVVFVIILIASALNKSEVAEQINPDLVQGNVVESAQTTAPISSDFKLTVKAKGETYIVLKYISTVESGSSDSIFSGSLEAGKTETFICKEPIYFSVLDAENIELVQDGVALKTEGEKGLKNWRLQKK